MVQRDDRLLERQHPDAWTTNVQAWTHSMFEFSSQMETIEVFDSSRPSRSTPPSTTPKRSRGRCAVTPWRFVVGRTTRPGTPSSNAGSRARPNGPDGRPTQLTFLTTHDFGRPWVNWEKHLRGWERPEEK